ncbi:MAG: DNA-directed DNA polymerase II small subunit [Methanobacterium sp.]|jgi:DNA polymerase II small subunit|uniref:DNA-directed DNA polymerase II small subunit n=1 Tax=Methanobacterium sp. MZD130B TaxID=3394378 RepID=UPI00175B0BFF|nr:DNA-directed DNA polymerase II small subunit [Methanobacterium sp.]
MTENIISKFTDADILIDEEAYLKIKNYDDSSNLVESLINHITISSPEMVVLTGALVENYLNRTPSPKSYDQMAQSHLLPKEFNFEILKDTSRKSYTNGEIKDLSSYFQNRYHKLKEMLTNKSELKDVTSVKIATSLDDVVKIVGMVNDIRNTKNNHKLIELEDETGDATVLIHNENHEVFEQAERIVKDEVVGVVGSRKGSLIMASEIINPGVPRIDEKSMNFGTVFLSDIHIGSSTFLDSAFQRFIKWINGDFGDEEQREIANNVKYVVVAGDIVDGIGVYPSQDKELTIKDIHQQYEEAARLFGDINDVKIIIAPGNHDASRLAEPQPAIPEDYAKNLHDLKTTEFVSNPALVSLDGIKVLVYHGRSFDDMAMTVKGMSHQQSELIMKELLEKRHLAPIYGERTPLASEIEDHLVIDDIPDVFHTGHVHINSYKKYKGIHLINSGTFQSQTEFQKIYNIVPTCAQVPVINNGSLKMLDFN